MSPAFSWFLAVIIGSFVAMALVSRISYIYLFKNTGDYNRIILADFSALLLPLLFKPEDFWLYFGSSLLLATFDMMALYRKTHAVNDPAGIHTNPRKKIYETPEKLAFVFGIAGVAVIIAAVVNDINSSKSETAAAFAKLNASLPRKVDNITTLTKIEQQSNTLMYHFKIDDKFDKEKFTTVMRPTVLNALCGDKNAMLFLTQSDAKISYIYTDNADNVITIPLTRQDCP